MDPTTWKPKTFLRLSTLCFVGAALAPISGVLQWELSPKDLASTGTLVFSFLFIPPMMLYLGKSFEI
jgi:hypothetical protein